MDETNTHEVLELPNVQDILDKSCSFVVPKYQRGYRWTKEQVSKLMQDLYEFDIEQSGKGKEERCPFYCLQVLVVEEKDKNTFEVIDGQQRLTTMLILRQAFHIIQKIEESGFVELVLNSGSGILPQHMYEITYKTRTESKIWLKELTVAYLEDSLDGKTVNIEKFQAKNRDYHHFAEVLLAGIDMIKNHSDINWNHVLTNVARFIWYDKSKVPFEDENELIFNRLNATKIKLNNAELIKALFLQEGVYKNQGLIRRDQMAMDWDELEKKLQDPEFWMFVCNSCYATSYDTHIEYLFDMLQNKTDAFKDREYYTFDCYYSQYQKANDKYDFVQKEWEKVVSIYQMLREWFDERHFYHLTGYLLEYGKEKGEIITIPQLISKLYIDENKEEMMSKDQWLQTLKGLVKESLLGIKPEHLVYSREEMTQVLFLFNILQEDKRKNPNARFSFNRYKRVLLGLDDGIVWHKEHVASHSDYTPDLKKRQELARDLLEYFTGIDVPIDQIKNDEELIFVKNYEDEIKKLSNEEKALCEKLLLLFDKLPDGAEAKEKKEKDLQQVFYEINTFFQAVDPFVEEIQVGRGNKSEKDFIWNFVLLNSKTNMSYGNSIFPVKRKRILKDESDIFTLYGTRNVFDKTYSHRLSNLMTWGRRDAYDYWIEIKNTLKEYLPANFELPDYIKF